MILEDNTFDKIKTLEEKINSLQREVDDLYQENINFMNLISELTEKINKNTTQENNYIQYQEPVVDSKRTVTFTEQDFL